MALFSASGAATLGATAVGGPVAGAAVSTILGFLPPNRSRTPEENRAYRRAEIDALDLAARQGNMAALQQLNTWMLDGGLHSDQRIGLKEVLTKFYRETGRIAPANVAQALGIAQGNIGAPSTQGTNGINWPVFGAPGSPTVATAAPSLTPLLLLGGLALVAFSGE